MRGRRELLRRVQHLSDADLDRALAAALAHDRAEGILAAVTLPPRIRLERRPWALRRREPAA